MFTVKKITGNRILKSGQIYFILLKRTTANKAVYRRGNGLEITFQTEVCIK